MLNFPLNSPTCRLFGYVAGLALCLSLGSCEQPQALPASTTPAPSAPIQPNRYYLNAQASTKEVVEQLDAKTITRLDVLRGQQAADYAHDASINGVILVRTR